jgi:hypothetical protein
MVVTLIDSTWEGVTLVPPDGPVNILALPSNTATSFADVAGKLAETAGPSMGMLDSDHALVVGGPLEGKPQVAYVVDLGTGGITPVTGSAATYSRDFATITPFAGGALVAGGSRNPSTGATGLFVDTAEVYQPAPGGGPGGFGGAPPIPLLQGRSKHAAVALANGDTLLIGGETEARILLGTSGTNSLELIEPGSPSSMAVQGAALLVPRVSPSALLLRGIEGPRLLVGGGLDENGKAVSKVEWFDVPGAASNNAGLSAAFALDLCTASAIDRSGNLAPLAPCCVGSSLLAPPAFAPLEGGSALVVLSGAAPSGCPSNVLVLRDDFIVEIAPSAPIAMQPHLFAGARGEPVYFAESGFVGRWDPWNWQDNSFGLSLGQAAGGAPPLLATLSPDPGLALWLGQGSRIWGLRFDTRNDYSTDEPTTELLLSDPLEFAPDRLVNVRDSEGFIDVEPFESGVGVTVQNGAGVFLTDATFADFTLDFRPTGPLSLVLYDQATDTELTFDQSNCLPEVLDDSIRVVRTGGTLTATIGEDSVGPPGACAGGPAAADRVAIGFRAPLGKTATVSTVSVQRVGSSN